jgi:alpha-mannosidase
MQTALGLTTPVPLIATDKGPPHIGTTGWLFHLDTSNLVLTGMRPGGLELREVAADSASDLVDAVTARLLECAALSGHAEFRCVRNPRRAVLLDARGNRLLEASIAGDAVQFEVTPGDFVQVQVEF